MILMVTILFISTLFWLDVFALQKPSFYQGASGMCKRAIDFLFELYSMYTEELNIKQKDQLQNIINEIMDKMSYQTMITFPCFNEKVTKQFKFFSFVQPVRILFDRYSSTRRMATNRFVQPYKDISVAFVTPSQTTCLKQDRHPNQNQPIAGRSL
ncbi:hypothetical protein DFA_12370 [Cavenderia fasciculata]|uniref:Uncharacterized protein n=1 Tax=Cavenderia fasciculata TaxID=261658 RepID=F4QDH4_CACFS|nr:uncharacterized protein DFA_12370 [Cavenderia fasciculata]EGG14592.1 hypothetical protein DFA_12370 [Cavenderia fasciculata]|eukprot:XP_004366112.1 hypothetical protein DFA_12370 [Cavenderia fasciculata]